MVFHQQLARRGVWGAVGTLHLQRLTRRGRMEGLLATNCCQAEECQTVWLEGLVLAGCSLEEG